MTHRLGSTEIYVLRDGDFWLDGGVLFGIVPKVLWEKLLPPDSLNRVRLALNVLLVRWAGHWVLIETGIDRKPGTKHRELYGLGEEELILKQLAELSLSPEEISLVINTHLHFDHAGLNTRLEDGRYVPTFPRARYFIQEAELETARHLNERTRATYFLENVEPLWERGQLELLKGEAELLKGLSVAPLPGHVPGQQGVFIESAGERLAYVADLIPTLAHVPLVYISALDLAPLTSLELRKRWYPRWAEEGWIIATPHDPLHPLGRIELGPKGYRGTPLDSHS